MKSDRNEVAELTDVAGDVGGKSVCSLNQQLNWNWTEWMYTILFFTADAESSTSHDVQPKTEPEVEATDHLPGKFEDWKVWYGTFCSIKQGPSQSYPKEMRKISVLCIYLWLWKAVECHDQTQNKIGQSRAVIMGKSDNLSKLSAVILGGLRATDVV